MKHNFDETLLIETLNVVDRSGVGAGDMFAFGCDFMLSFVLQNDHTNDHLYEKVPNVQKHTIELINNWDSWTYYNPIDIRGLVFDFSLLSTSGKVVAYNGLAKNFKRDIVCEFSIDEFVKEYGMRCFYSTAHYNVCWKNLGFNWGN